ncbi:Cation efflux protein: zinc transporter [Fasciolopsis buskii]|uniref:Cation efflux protein: zinc transporter n=1 Tax=Fasciolopsis buskii TaxID=27845 RepID=A0A8E0VMY1_9TREM|nr:Cation efflux protein: zinc transporter [Fasciolopsis buski]
MCFHCGNTTRLVSMMCLVATYFLVELIVGYVIHSIALVADAFHMLSDFLALVVGVIAARIAKWPSSSKNTFGWQRAEVMGGLINTVVLITLCSTILMNAIQRFIEPEPIVNPRLMVYVGAGGLAVNVLGLIVLGAHSHDNTNTTFEVTDEGMTAAPLTSESDGERGATNYIHSTALHSQSTDGNQVTADGKNVQTYMDGSQFVLNKANNTTSPIPNSHAQQLKPKKVRRPTSMNMRAVFLHVLADFFGSIIVVVSALVLWLVPGDPAAEGAWKLYVDPAMSVLMVIIILTSAVPLMYKATLILLQSVPSEICLKNLKSRLENIDGIHKVHDLHVWRLQSNCIIGTVHIRCASLPDYLNIARQVKELFHEFDIHCTTIQPEFEEYSEEQVPTNIDYQACVLDCGPNKGCQSDTCCPAPPNAQTASNSMPMSTSQPTFNSDTVNQHRTRNGPSSTCRPRALECPQVRIPVFGADGITDKSSSSQTSSV